MAGMRLGDRLDALRKQLRQPMNAEDQATVGRAIERLRMLQVVEHSLVAGETLPDFALPDATGRIVTSEDLVSRGPLVVNFFRGGWCPYCTLALQGFDAVLPEIERLGGSLVAISPVKPGQLAETAATHGLRQIMLSDPADRYAMLCGVHYEMSADQVALYRKEGLDLDAVNAAGGWRVPIPATYVVGRDGVVAYAFADADWSRRAEPAAVLESLRGLAQAADAVSAARPGATCSARSTNAFTGGE